MSATDLIALLVTVALLAYLTWAMLRGEKL
jgi:hypothetical protein